MAWRPAKSVQTLKDQLDATFPGWKFLGFIGDQSHASGASDHNPNSEGVVTAIDIGPGGGLDIHKLANQLVANPHPDLKYIISNGRIANWQTNFKWQTYSGSDPHDTHIHVSVGRGPDGQSKPPYDDNIKWSIMEGDMQPTPEQVGKVYKAMTGSDITQKDLDFYITAPRTLADLVYGLLPGVEKTRADKQLLEKERDEKLYPAYTELQALKKTDAVKRLDEVKKIVNS